MRRRNIVALACLVPAVAAGGIATGPGDVALGSLLLLGAGPSVPPSLEDAEFPTTATTGVPSGTSLTAYAGSNPVTADDTVIDGKTISNCLVINANNVTVRNSLIESSDGCGIYVDDANGKTGLVVEDVEIDCTSATGGTGISEADLTARRVEIRSCENGFSLSQNTTIEDSLIWKLENGGADPHEDGIQLACGHHTGVPTDVACSGGAPNYLPGAANITVTGNSLWGVNKDDSLGTSAMIMNPTTNGDIDTDIIIDGNLLVGGGTVVYCPRPGVGTNVQIINNTIDQRSTGTDDCADEAAVSGNVEYGTGDPYVLD